MNLCWKETKKALRGAQSEERKSVDGWPDSSSAGPSEGSAGVGHREQLMWEPLQIQVFLWGNGQVCELKVLCH